MTKRPYQSAVSGLKRKAFFFPDDISLPMKFCLDECQAKTFHAIRYCETPGCFTNIKIECFENLCIIFLGSVMYLRSISTRSPWYLVIAEYCYTGPEVKTMHSSCTYCILNSVFRTFNIKIVVKIHKEILLPFLFISTVLHRTTAYRN